MVNARAVAIHVATAAKKNNLTCADVCDCDAEICENREGYLSDKGDDTDDDIDDYLYSMNEMVEYML